MKKLISSILALSLVAGMSVTAFAAQGAVAEFASTGTGHNVDFSDAGGTSTFSFSQSNFLQDDTSTGTEAPTGAFTWSTSSLAVTSVTDNGSTGITAATLGGSGATSTVRLNVPANTTTSVITYNVDVVVTLTPASSTAGSQMTYTINFNGDIAAPTSTSASYVTGYKIDDVINGDGVELGSTTTVEFSGMAKGSTNLNNLDIRPDAEIKIYLASDEFDWIDSNDNVIRGTNSLVSGKVVSESQLRTGKITVRKSVSKGSNVIEDISFDSDSKAKGAYIFVEFVEWFVSVDEQDVDFTIYLAKSGSKRSDTELNIAGTMENEQDEVDEGDDYISTEDGTVFEAQDYVRGCEVYLGNGVYITTNLFKNKKYYGIALNTYDSTDSAIMDEYPEIDNVLTLKTVNLKGSGNIVTFDMTGDYYVYGTDGTYLGLSSEAVPYSDKYYFATERINIKDGDLDDDDDVILDEDDDDDYVGPSDGGGDDANNANDNPGTGVNGFVGVAVAAGLISLAAVGVTARKKK